MELTSPAFEDGARIDSKYTCDGQDISPPLSISGVPEGAASVVLVMEDPDAPGGTWDHWIVWNIPVETTSIQEGTEPEGVQGTNGWGERGYGGPCPPSGTHRYRFKLYAVDTVLDLSAGARKAELEQAMRGHVLAQDELVAKYSR